MFATEAGRNVFAAADLDGDGSVDYCGWRDVDVGLSHACGLLSDGRALCWGDNEWGQLTVPLDADGNDYQFKSVVAGHAYSCGLTEQGTVACWGSDIGFHAWELDGFSFDSISAGYGQFCGVKTDGDVECFGYQKSTLAGPFIRIDTGYKLACGVKANGSVECVGYNRDGQASPPNGMGFTSVSAGFDYACGVRGGAIECWGWNGSGEEHLTETYVDVSVGARHICGLMGSGEVDCGGGYVPSSVFTMIDSDGTNTSNGVTCGITELNEVQCWSKNGMEIGTIFSPPTDP